MRAFALAVLLATALLLPDPSRAADPSSEQILQKLEPPPRTRSFGRGVSVTGAPPEPPPAIDLHIPFAFNSAQLETDAQIVLGNLGKALSDPRLAAYTFTIAGHTDSVGSDAFNMELSQRRATTVRDWLVSKHGVDVKKLTVVGYGESRPADAASPEAAINRRVQIINTGTVAKAN